MAVALAVGACGSGKSSNLTKLVLTAQEASRAGAQPVSLSTGPGSRILTGAGSTTLDQCAPSYASEGARKARYQVAYVEAAGRVAASNEVVRYTSGGASQSYQELTAALQHCAPQNGATEFEVAARNGDLLSKQAAFSFRVAQAGAPVYEAAVYQYNGDLLDVTYAFRPDRATALTAANAMAKVARHKIA